MTSPTSLSFWHCPLDDSHHGVTPWTWSETTNGSLKASAFAWLRTFTSLSQAENCPGVIQLE
jgi:hypothetical protein